MPLPACRRCLVVFLLLLLSPGFGKAFGFSGSPMSQGNVLMLYKRGHRPLFYSFLLATNVGKTKKSMKDKAMRIALISVIALWGLLFPQMLLAEENSEEFTMTPRAQKIFDQASKTP